MKREKDFGERTASILQRLHRADKRDGGMRLSVQDVADLAYYLSTQISGAVELLEGGAEKEAGR